ncbi:LysR family transcriptional regulator [Burkholderia sp. Ac-20379]|uniref:LysR family transcriptional regulator n=1 Tax=Burkholderia sp. Ac-20379 TaxID=2703900 RepID=UPI00197EBAAC|nr:LysR family transcriptional regulator [Burkholderia sp. Ac-20379]MBN3727986.1 LysR family transcriptional regulator [Burkholderia sp. Ac-20379]
MQITWLEDFMELARTRSFSRAADNRAVTHPAFGRRIKALEEWVGAELVERRQPVVLTAAGAIFLDAATVATDVLHAARAQFQDASAAGEPVLRIATGRTLARTFFPDWYDALSRRIGAFPVSVSTGGAQEVVMRLATGDVDLLVIYSSPTTRLLIDPQRYESITLARETLLPVSAPDAAGRPKFSLAPSPAAPIPWLSFAPTLTLRGVLAKHLASLAQKLPLRMVYQADSYESILEMAKRGTGVGWLPRGLVQDALRDGSLVPIGDAGMSVGFDISLYRLRGHANPLVDAIWHSASAVDDTPNPA